MHERVAGNRSVLVAVVDQIGHSTVLLTCNRAMKMVVAISFVVIEIVLA